MEPEDQTPQDDEVENNSPEGQEPSSSNTFPGRSAKRAQQAYDAYRAPENIKKLNRRARKTTQKAKNMAKKAGQKARKAGKMVRSGVQSARAAYAAAQATYTIVASVVSLKIIIIIIIIIIILLVVLKIISNDGSGKSSSAQLTSSGPILAKIGDKLDYTITINYPGTVEDIVITDQIPDGTEYVNAPQATYDPATNTVTWDMTAITGSASGSPSANINTTLSLTLLATKDNDYIINTPKGIIRGAVLGVKDSSISNESLTPTVFQVIPNKVLGENDSQPSTLNVTPTLFQKLPTNTPMPPSGTNIISSCVVTKIGDPEVIPSLRPECTSF